MLQTSRWRRQTPSGVGRKPSHRRPLFYVYILEYRWQGLERYYVGQTKNAFFRIMDHYNGHGALRPLVNGVTRIVNVIACENRKSARIGEAHIQELVDMGLDVPEPSASFMSLESMNWLERYFNLRRYN